MSLKKRKMKKGTKYKIKNSEAVFTAKSFRGNNGKDYDTLKDARSNNPDDPYLIVTNEEYNGFSRIDQIKTVLND